MRLFKYLSLIFVLLLSTAYPQINVDYMRSGLPNPNWRDPVSSAAVLPVLDNNTGDVRTALDTMTLYGWDGASWIALTGGGGGSGLTIGGAVTPVGGAGDPKEILFISNGGLLTSSENMIRDSVSEDTAIVKIDGTFTNVLRVGDPFAEGIEATGAIRSNSTGDAPDATIAAIDGTGFGFDATTVFLSYGDNNISGSLAMDSTGIIGQYTDASGNSPFLNLSTPGAFIGHTDGATFNRFFYSDSTDIGWQDTIAPYKFRLPKVDGTSGQAIITNAAGVLSFGNANIGIGGSITGGTAHEVLYTNASVQTDSDAAFIRNMSTNISSLSNTSGGITVGWTVDPAVGSYMTWANSTTTAAAIVDQRGLQARGSTNQVTLETFVAKQASGLKLMELKNSGLFFVNNSTVAATAVMFTGGGLDDMTQMPLTSYTGLAQSTTYTITIDGNGVADTFTWTDGTTTVNNVNIVIGAQSLSNGVEITFAATTGHTLNDSWTFDVDYSIGKTIYANGNVTSIEVSIGDYDGLFNRTVLAVQDATQTITGRTGISPSPDQLLHVSGSNDYVALGFQTGTAGSSVYIGTQAGFGDTGGGGNTAIGALSLVNGAFPPPLPVSGVRNTAVGAVSGFGNNGDDNIYFGYETRMIGGPWDHSGAFGREAYINRSGQFAFGSGLVSYAVNDFVFGGQERGYYSVVTLRTSDGEVASNASGASMYLQSGNAGGTDVDGVDITLQAGRATGTGLNGNFEVLVGVQSGTTGTASAALGSPFLVDATQSIILIGDHSSDWATGSFLTVDMLGYRTFSTLNMIQENTGLLSYGSGGTANDVTLSQGNFFINTTTTQMNEIGVNNIQAGTQFCIKFNDVVTIKHNTAGSGAGKKIFLAGSVDFVTANHTVWCALYDGTQIQETSRKAP